MINVSVGTPLFVNCPRRGAAMPRFSFAILRQTDDTSLRFMTSPSFITAVPHRPSLCPPSIVIKPEHTLLRAQCAEAFVAISITDMMSLPVTARSSSSLSRPGRTTQGGRPALRRNSSAVSLSSAGRRSAACLRLIGRTETACSNRPRRYPALYTPHHPSTKRYTPYITVHLMCACPLNITAAFRS